MSGYPSSYSHSCSAAHEISLADFSPSPPSIAERPALRSKAHQRLCLSFDYPWIASRRLRFEVLHFPRLRCRASIPQQSSSSHAHTQSCYHQYKRLSLDSTLIRIFKDIRCTVTLYSSIACDVRVWVRKSQDREESWAGRRPQGAMGARAREQVPTSYLAARALSPILPDVVVVVPASETRATSPLEFFQG